MSHVRVSQTIANLFLPLVDLSLLALGFILAMRVRVGWPPPAFNWEGLRVALPWTMLMALIIYYALGLYRNNRSLVSIYKQLAIANVAVFLTLAALAFWLRAFSVPRSVMLVAFLFHCLLLGAWRTLHIGIKMATHGKQRLLLVGTEADCHAIRAKLDRLPPGWFILVDALTPEAFWTQAHRFRDGVQAVVVGGSVNHETRRRLLMWLQQANISTYMVPDLYDIMVDGHGVDQLDDLPVFCIEPLGLSSLNRFFKRVFDMAVALPLAVLATPILLAAVVMIRVTSKGPAFYAQERVGQNGKTFTLLKLRSMVVDAEKGGPQLAVANDSRITPVGRFLRKTRIDELPQLLMVLLGHMSLVGPRPERPVFVDRFTKENPEYELRHLVKPGVTGLAQIFGYYSTSANDKLRLDLHYVRNQSLWLDIKILLLTVRTVLTPDQAEGLSRTSVNAGLNSKTQAGA
ncbi:MAG TPA: sugar transferase [Symbiobacteriaceae bacterium]|nr:sugar transferase [Symbiobacteriaceae bacterium]